MSRSRGRPTYGPPKSCTIQARVTQEEFDRLFKAYPGLSQSEAIRNLIGLIPERDPERLRREAQEHEERARDALARAREVEDAESEARLVREAEAQRMAVEEEARRVRQEWLRTHGTQITNWVNQSEGVGDPVAFIESLAPPDEATHREAVETIKRAQKRRGLA